MHLLCYMPFCEKWISFIKWLLCTYYVPGSMLCAGSTEASSLLSWNDGERAHKGGCGHFHLREGSIGVPLLDYILEDEWYQQTKGKVCGWHKKMAFQTDGAGWVKVQEAGSGPTRLSYKKGAEQEMDRRARSGIGHEEPYMPSNVGPNLCLIANGESLLRDGTQVTLQL